MVLKKKKSIFTVLVVPLKSDLTRLRTSDMDGGFSVFAAKAAEHPITLDKNLRLANSSEFAEVYSSMKGWFLNC